VDGGVVKLSVVVPVYNEEETVVSVLEKVVAQNTSDIELEILVIDDGSTDGTRAVLAERPHLYSHLVCLPHNRGKGGAVKAGLEKATGDYVLFQDGDLEYDPNDYSTLMVPIVRFGADVVMGSRLIGPAFTRVHYFWHKVGNYTITLIFNMLNNTTFTDVYSCYLVYRRDLVDPARLQAEGWDQHAEILSKAVRRGSTFYEVPITYRGRTYAEGKKIRARHILSVVWRIIRERFFPSA
jgi:glycosyltransferase involved in cell wall biosynthesis